MADIKIVDLNLGTVLGANDALVLVQGDTTLQVSGQSVAEGVKAIANLADKAYVDAIVAGAPELLDTLNELAAAIGDDPNFGESIRTILDSKLPTDHFGLEFWNALAGVTTYHIAEDTNLYFTEQRVLDVLSANPADRLISNGNELVLGTNGTLSTPLLLPKTFTAILDSAHMVRGVGLTDTPFEYGVTFACNPDGTVETQIDGNRVWPVNPGYINGDSFTYTEADHGIPGYTFTITINPVYTGPAGWGANISCTPPPEYPSTIKSLGAIKLTANESSWTFSTDGKLTLPADPTNSQHAATKGYVDSQLSSISSPNWNSIVNISNDQGPTRIALGRNAGGESDADGYGGYGSYGGGSSPFAIAIGNSAGRTNQGGAAIGIGVATGYVDQGEGAIAIGLTAGNISQGLSAIAVGESSGNTLQGLSAIAIGNTAGYTNQGSNAIAIGKNAGRTNQPAGSIVISASGNELNGNATGLYIDPIRSATVTDYVAYYNPTTKEVTYGPAPTSGGGSDPTFTSVTTGTLNVQSVAFTGTGVVNIASGNDLNLTAAGEIYFNGERTISLKRLKTVVAASTDFADFKARIAVL